MIEIALGAFLIVEKVLHEIDKYQWSRREDTLLNRIQAKDLQEFVAVERKPERVQPPKQDKTDDVPDYAVIDRPEIDYVGVSAAERALNI